MLNFGKMNTPEERILDFLIKQPSLEEFILKFEASDRLIMGLFLMYLAIEDSEFQNEKSS